MIMNEFMAKISGFWFFHRWHPEVALRYLPIVDNIRRINKKIKILEIGSGGLGIAPYLKRQITGVDQNFEKPFDPLLKRINASATHLPFGNNSFEVVLSVDMLEHMENKVRTLAIKEIFRVASNKVIIAVPCGKDAEEQDILLDQYYQKHFGERFHFLKEQIEFGLPEKKDIYDTIAKAAKYNKKKIRIRTVGNENLKLRMFLMKGWSSDDIVLNIIFRKLFILFVPVFRLFNQEPTYRQLFFVDIQNENSN